MVTQMAEVVIGGGDDFGSVTTFEALVAERRVAEGYNWSCQVGQGYYEDLSSLPEGFFGLTGIAAVAPSPDPANPSADIIRAEGRAVVTEFEPSFEYRYFDYEGAIVQMKVYPDERVVSFVVFSNYDQQHAVDVCAKLSSTYHAEKPEPKQDFVVDMTFTYMTVNGVNYTSRNINVRPWDETRKNYPEKALIELEGIMAKPELTEQDGKIIILHGPPGTGKEQPVSEPVLTPDGWIPIGSVRPGDYVIGSDGKPTAVTGVYPQGRKDVYEIEFSDGSSTRCGLEHLWQVQSKDDRANGRDRTLSVADMLGTGLRTTSGHKRYSIPMMRPADLEERGKKPLAPYLLGVLLGDGGFTGSSVMLSSPDAGVLERVRQLLPEGVSLNRQGDTVDYRLAYGKGKPNPVIESLRELGLWGLGSKEKFIPDAYLGGSASDRLLLLRGLMDADGTPQRAGGTEYSTSSPRLARDVAQLTMSLGGTARTGARLPRYTYNDETRTGAVSYRVNVKLPVNPFSLQRKADAWIAPTKYPVTRYISDIRKLNYREHSVCIKVAAADELYVTHDYIVTHNTSFLRSLAWQWRDWARFSVVIEPEVFLHNAAYMTEMLLKQSTKYRWLIMEDCGELITQHAQAQGGQGVSRLLNMADGILGQGQRLGFIITTNQPLNKLDPAVTRPGRCLATVEVDKFTAKESSVWLGYEVDRAYTLADLYSLGSDNVLAPVSESSGQETGLYL